MNNEQEQLTNEHKTIQTSKPRQTKRGPTTCIRLNEDLHKELTKISKATGKSIPQIFIEALKNKKPAIPLMHNELAKNVIKELNRIGGNVNQIAKKLNTGIYEGWYPQFKEFYKQHTELYMLVSNYGKGKR